MLRKSISVLRFIIAALISYELSFWYHGDQFWSVVSSLLTLQSIPHDRMPFLYALSAASDRIVGSILGCLIGLSSYIFLSTIVLEDYFFVLVDLTIILNIGLAAYLYSASRRLQMAIVSSSLILTMSFLSEDISILVLSYVYEIMIGVLVSCFVYLVTLPIFYFVPVSIRKNF